MRASSASSITGPSASDDSRRASSARRWRRRSVRSSTAPRCCWCSPKRPTAWPWGATLLAIDAVGAGVSERVIVVIEGRAAGEALGQKLAPVDAAIIGIVDHVHAVD